MIPYASVGLQEQDFLLRRTSDLMKLRRAKRLPGKLFVRNQ
jgi:hypothetical protein